MLQPIRFVVFSAIERTQAQDGGMAAAVETREAIYQSVLACGTPRVFSALHVWHKTVEQFPVLYQKVPSQVSQCNSVLCHSSVCSVSPHRDEANGPRKNWPAALQ